MKPYGNSLIMDFSKAFIARPFMMSFKIRENSIKPIKTNRARVEIELKLSLSLRQKVITSPHDLLLIRKFVCRTEAINVWPNFRKSIKSLAFKRPNFFPPFFPELVMAKVSAESPNWRLALSVEKPTLSSCLGSSSSIVTSLSSSHLTSKPILPDLKPWVALKINKHV